MKVPFSLAQAPAYFQELMTGILKDFPFAIAYLDDIIIFSKTPQEHLSHIQMVFEKTQVSKPFHEENKCSFFSKEIQHLGHTLSATGIRATTCQNSCHTRHATTNDTQTSQSLLWISRLLQKVHQGICKDSKTTNPSHQIASKI